LKYVCDIVVKKFTFAISATDEFLYETALSDTGEGFMLMQSR